MTEVVVGYFIRRTTDTGIVTREATVQGVPSDRLLERMANPEFVRAFYGTQWAKVEVVEVTERVLTVVDK